MISVMVVEDEFLTRDFLQDIIPKVNPEFVVVDSAANGQKALEKLKEYPVDVLITDIKMPVLDGLQLCEIIDRIHPDTQKVILSGYDDFSYAQRSIDLNIRGYLLKPINLEKLKALLNRLQSSIQHKKTRIAEEKSYSESKMWLRELFFQAQTLSLIMQTNTYIRITGDHPQLGNYLMALVTMKDKTDFASDPDTKTDLLQIVAKENSGMTFTDMKDIFVLLFPSPANIHNTIQSIKKYLAAQPLDIYTAFIAGIGNRSLPEKYRQGRALLVKHMYQGQYEDYKEEVNERSIIDRLETIHLEPYIQIDQTMNELSAAIHSQTYPIIKRLIIQLLSQEKSVCNTDAERLNFTIKLFKRWFILNKKDEIVHAAFENSFASGAEQNISLFISLLTGAETESDIDYSSICEQAKSYILEHFSEPISLTDIADHIGINAHYLSNLFSKDVGISFTKYLTNLRMEMAAIILRMNPSVKIYELAYNVGYPNEKYFLYVFRKHYGMTPSQFKSNQYL